ncbi:uncharacterized protein VP01_2962g9 [Puccinia sorghi]|uniref:Large ribosomal subunit protein uL30 N-terminal eukaryotes domain-containing protein n=1 Tax=Puccinia sorghi TaxID=27349 RepID=A0A0L6V0W9_9BASI|nr:uncharacterized protein VP01_2962g9 [Puccinia sorghi]
MGELSHVIRLRAVGHDIFAFPRSPPAGTTPAGPSYPAEPADRTKMPASTSVPTAQDVLVPETLLKKRKVNEKAREEKLAKAIEARKASKAKRQVIFKRAEQYVIEYKRKEREAIRLRRAAKLTSISARIEGFGRLLCPIRAKGLFRYQAEGINNGVFIKVTRATTQMLQMVEPYVTYGEPNLKTVRELIYKRGYGKINKQRIPLDNNAIIEQHLGKYGIISIEDIVHEIITVGPNFKQVSNFLYPFHLSNPTSGFRARKFTAFVEGGDAGKREHYINKLVRNMN